MDERDRREGELKKRAKRKAAIEAAKAGELKKRSPRETRQFTVSPPRRATLQL